MLGLGQLGKHTKHLSQWQLAVRLRESAEASKVAGSGPQRRGLRRGAMGWLF